MRIPFDSLNLAAVVHELSAYEGAKLQRILQPDPLTICLGLYKPGGEAMLLLSADAVFARAHFITRRPGRAEVAYGLLQALRARIEGAHLASARQIGFDRILELEFERSDGRHKLIAELMGKHANLVFVDAHHRILSCAKTVGPTKSKRPITPGGDYAPPPFEPKPSLLRAKPADDLSQCEGASPFLLKWIGANDLETVQQAVRSGDFHPVISPDHGAYPLSVASLGLPEFPRNTISIALEQYFDRASAEQESESLRRSLLGQIDRVILAREVALRDLQQAREAAAGAPRRQLLGELILAYQGSIKLGDTKLEAWDYAGEPVEISLLPDLTPIENANRYFDKAKRAKARAGQVEDQHARQAASLAELQRVRALVLEAKTIPDLKDLQEQAKAKRWLNLQTSSGKAKEDRPYEGHRVREMLAPGGYTLLYGENAESNDYLTLRVARPNDWWLHIRGGVSAHVVIRTDNQPDRVSREALLYAAQIAVQNSPSKHAGLVAVDYTLKKYVRKGKGAPTGTAFYTNEKTLHIEGGKS